MSKVRIKHPKETRQGLAYDGTVSILIYCSLNSILAERKYGLQNFVSMKNSPVTINERVLKLESAKNLAVNGKSLTSRPWLHSTNKNLKLQTYHASSTFVDDAHILPQQNSHKQS